MSALLLSRGSIDRLGQVADFEWLVTNGVGGFASSSVSFMNTRRYHGLLIASLRPPVERVVMVSSLSISAEYLGQTAALGTHEYADGTIAPKGLVHLRSFRLEGLLPVWSWQVGAAVLEQRLWMRHGENTTYVQFNLIDAAQPLRLFIEPLCTYRDYHWQLRGSRDFGVEPVDRGIRLDARGGARPYRLLSGDAKFHVDPAWHWNVRHRAESARGLDDAEDLFRPARIECYVAPGASTALVLTAEEREPVPAAAALEAELQRQRDLLEQQRSGRPPARISVPAIEQLTLAADQFVVERRDAMGTPRGKTVIAGYPWFSDWGRDTMIALPGLTLSTGRPQIAASVLRTFAGFVSQGMIPNRFPDAGETPEYNTVDASLWFFVAVHALFQATADRDFIGEIYPTLKQMLDWHVRGTRYGIGMDESDGLLRAGEAGVQLTWMDAKVGDWVITPRIGKPVEINALWFNAIAILRDFASLLKQEEDAGRFGKLADRVKAHFEPAFWCESGGYLYDVVDGPEGDRDETGRQRDASFRPNQLFALSLPHALVSPDKAKRIIDSCTVQLLTPVGLRSLSPSDPRYVALYGGGPRERDGAYHQGTVWSWLLGPYITAHYRIYKDPQAALRLLDGFAAHLNEACVGQVSEIMDGQAPFEPRGCIAQAWGVAEILRAWSDINECESRQQAAQEDRHRHARAQAR